jgi:hypothetical protein
LQGETQVEVRASLQVLKWALELQFRRAGTEEEEEAMEVGV